MAAVEEDVLDLSLFLSLSLCLSVSLSLSLFLSLSLSLYLSLYLYLLGCSREGMLGSMFMRMIVLPVGRGLRLIVVTYKLELMLDLASKIAWVSRSVMTRRRADGSNCLSRACKHTR